MREYNTRLSADRLRRLGGTTTLRLCLRWLVTIDLHSAFHLMEASIKKEKGSKILNLERFLVAKAEPVWREAL